MSCSCAALDILLAVSSMTVDALACSWALCQLNQDGCWRLVHRLKHQISFLFLFCRAKRNIFLFGESSVTLLCGASFGKGEMSRKEGNHWPKMPTRLSARCIIQWLVFEGLFRWQQYGVAVCSGLGRTIGWGASLWSEQGCQRGGLDGQSSSIPHTPISRCM
jgi:hypothetical protein